MTELDEFGKFLMTYVRDKAIEQINDIIDKTEKGISTPSTNLMSELIKKDYDSAKAVSKLSVDTALAFLLGAFEENPEFIITTRISESSSDLNSMSDGFEGELYGDNGWISKYSKHPE